MEKEVATQEMFLLVRELLEHKAKVIFRVTGNSMLPFLADHRDKVCLEACDPYGLRPGDIILYETNGSYILHRIYQKKGNQYITMGDGNLFWDSPVMAGQIVGKVCQIYRRDKEISCENLKWKMLFWFWRRMVKHRYRMMVMVQKGGNGMKAARRWLTFGLTVTVLLSGILAGRITSRAADREYAGQVVYFPVTMWNYDGSKLNAATRKLRHSLNYNPGQMLYFVNGADHQEDSASAWNYWRKGYTPARGIVADTLDASGRIQFSPNCTNAGLFDNDEENAEEGRTVYTDVQFPMAYDADSGYYEFYALNNHVHVNPQIGSGQTLTLYEGMQSIDGFQCFFPFNTDADRTPDYYFGMSVSIPFRITENGIIQKEDGTTEEMKFDFSGDDDVWVFLDGKLVLDLGGIHDELAGQINFATGQITYSYPHDGANAKNALFWKQLQASGEAARMEWQMKKDAYNMYDTLFPQGTETFSDEGVHNLQIYYLERGADSSNCRIRFNMHPISKLMVGKQMSDTAFHTGESYTMKIVSAKESDQQFLPFAQKDYTLFENNTSTGKTGRTNEEGELTLQAGQDALFRDPEAGVYQFIEQENRYEAGWVTQKIGEESTKRSVEGKTSELLSIAETTGMKIVTYSAICTNQVLEEPLPKEDVVVLDYGKKTKIKVLDNDVITEESWKDVSFQLAGIGEKGTTIQASYATSMDGFQTEPLELKEGTLSMKSENGEAYLEYEMTHYLDTVEEAAYAVSYQIPGGSDTVYYKSTGLTILPASTVYYEDNFQEKQEDGTRTNAIVITSAAAEGRIETVFEGAAGDAYQDDGHVGKDAPYGYDSSYEQNDGFSDGSAQKISASDGRAVTAEFTFTGTGFDVIGRTDGESGIVLAQVYDMEQKLVDEYLYDFYYSSGVLYQIPVFTVHNFPALEERGYGTYRVKLSVMGKNALSEKNTFYLDAVRIHNPLGTTLNQMGSTAVRAYQEDLEYHAVQEEIRNLLLDEAQAQAVQNENLAYEGMVYVDHEDQVIKAAQYQQYGPSNEVYLKKENAVTFDLDYREHPMPATVQLGVKAPEGKTTMRITVTKEAESGGESETKVSDAEITSATDLYHDLTALLNLSSEELEKVRTITISNVGDHILALTTIKITDVTDGNEIAGAKVLFRVSRETMEKLQKEKRTVFGEDMAQEESSEQETEAVQQTDLQNVQESDQQQTEEQKVEMPVEDGKTKRVRPVLWRVKRQKGQKDRLTWKKVPHAQGYEIYCAAGRNKAFKKIREIKRGGKNSCTISKRKKQVRYRYKIRACLKENGKKVYSAYSKVKGVRGA